MGGAEPVSLAMAIWRANIDAVRSSEADTAAAGDDVECVSPSADDGDAGEGDDEGDSRVEAARRSMATAALRGVSVPALDAESCWYPLAERDDAERVIEAPDADDSAGSITMRALGGTAERGLWITSQREDQDAQSCLLGIACAPPS